jgi:hypothetical protein
MHFQLCITRDMSFPNENILHTLQSYLYDNTATCNIVWTIIYRIAINCFFEVNILPKDFDEIT